MGAFSSLSPIAPAFPRKHGNRARGPCPFAHPPLPGMRGPWPVVRDWPGVARGPWPVVVAPWPALRGAWLLARALRGLIRAPWRVVHGACAVVRAWGAESR